MNKHLYRIVFNKRRGQMMVVAETTSSQGKSAAGETGAAGGTGASTRGAWRGSACRPLCLALYAALGSLAALPLHAQIVADPSAPGAQRPVVLVTNSGVPQVDIQTPSAAGVSRNTYTQFDVDGRGVILNNSRTDTQTQIGGWIHGNGNLAGGSARVILNEVNSSNPSQLGGFVEVAGQRAEVVIANPAGLKVDGGGFINASRVTLTTGAPIMNGGSLEGYSVQRGLVTITGKGLDATQADYTAILARAAQFNAGIWARELRVVTGANRLDTAHNVTGAAGAEGPAPAFALDVAQIGGMYAGKITLVGTEAGLGVRNAGTLAASAGELRLDANGWLVNSGTLQASGAVALGAAGDVTNSGTVRAGADALVTTGGNIGNSGSLSAAGNLALRADGAQSRIDAVAGSLLAAGLNADGTMGPSGELGVRATGAVALRGSALAGGTGTIAGNTLDLAGAVLDGGALSLTASGGDLHAAGADIAARGQLALNAADTLRTDAATLGAGQLAITAGSLSNVGGDIAQTGTRDLAIRLPGQLDNTGGRIATNSGNVALGAQALANAGGTISHAGTGLLSIETGRIDGQGGVIASNGRLDIATGAFDHRGASTSAAQLGIHAGTLDNSGGTIAQTGAGQGALALDQGLNNTGGAIDSGGSLALTAAALTNRQGRITAQQGVALTLAGALDNTGGSLAGSTLALRASALDNTSGMVQAVGADGTLVVGRLDNNGGSISASGDLRTSAASLDNSGSLYAGSSQELNVSGALANTGMIAARGDTTITAASLAGGADGLLGAGIGADGALAGSGALRVATTGALTTQGQVHAAGAATLSGASLDLSGSETTAASIALAASAGSVDTGAAQVTTDGTLAVTTDAAAGQGWRNAGGQVHAGQLAVQANFIDNTGGSIVQAGSGDTALQLAGPASVLDNTGGRIVAASANFSLRADTVRNAGGRLEHAGSGGLLLRAGVLDNTDGLVQSAGSFTLDTGALLNHAGELSAAGDLRVSVDGDLETDGLLYAGGNQALEVAGALDNAGSIAAGGHTSITAASVNSSGLLGAGLDTQGALAGAGSLSVSATGTVAAKGQNIAAGSLQVQAGAIDLAGSETAATGIALDAGTGAIDTRGATVTAAATLALQGGALRNSGGQLAGRDLDIAVAALDNAAGEILQAGQGTLSIQAATFENGAGRIAGDGSIDIHAGDVNNTGGTISGAQGMALAAGDVDNTGGQIRSVAGDVALAVRDLDNDAGTVFAGGDLATSARNLANSGSLYASGTQTLAASGTVENSGAIAAGGNTAITAASLASSGVLGAGLNADGSLGEAGDLTVATGGGLQAGGRNIAAGSASLAGASLDLADSETAASQIALAAQDGAIDTRGALVTTPGTLSASAREGVLANSGGVLSAGQLDLQVGAIDNTAGTILQTGSGDTAIRTGILDNTGGRLAVNSHDLTVEAAALRNAGGRLEHAGAGALLVQAGPVDNRLGRIASVGTATLVSTGVFDNTGGVASAAGSLHLGADGVDNSNGLVRSTAGELVLDAGLLLNAEGELSAAGDLRANVAGDLLSDGLLYAGGDQRLNVGGTLYNDGAIAALGDTTIVAGAVDSTGLLGAGLDENGEVSGSGALSVTAGSTTAGGQNLAGGDLAFSGGAIDLAGSETAGMNIRLDAGAADLDARAAIVTAGGSLTVAAGHVDNTAGQLAANALALDAASLDNTGGAIVQRGSGDMRVDAGTIDNTSGRIAAAGGNLDLGAGQVVNHDGLLSAAGSLHLNAADVGNTGGEIRAAGGDLALNVRDLDNSAGTVFAGADLATSARNIANSGSMYAAGSQTIAASGAVSNSGVIAAQGDTTLAAASLAGNGLLGAGIHADGTLAADGDLAVTTSGALQAGGENLAAGSAAFAGGSLDLAGSDTSAASLALRATDGDVDTSGALLTTPGALRIDARQGSAGLVNAGGVLSAGQLDLQASAIRNTGGTILQTGSGDTTIATGTLDNSGGRLAVNSGNLDIAADTLDNTGGRIEHAGTGTLAVDAGLLRNGAGRITSSGSAAIAAIGNIENAAGIIAAANELRIAGQAVANQGGLMQAQTGALTLDASTLANGDGEVSAGIGLRLSTSGDLGNDGLLYAGGALDLDVGGTLRSGGSIAALGDTTIEADSLQSTGLLAAGLTADGEFAAGGELRVTTAQALSATGQNVAAGDLVLRGARVNLADSETSAANIGIDATAGDVDTSAALVKADGELAIASASGALVNTGGELSASRIALDVATLRNQGGDIVQTDTGDLRIDVTELDNTAGRIAAAAGSLDIAAGALRNTGGALLASNNLGLAAGTVDNAGGEIRAAGGNLSLSADTIANGAGGSIYAAGDLNTSAGSVDNGGSLYAGGKQTLSATGAVNNDGAIAAQGNTSITAGSLSGGADALLGAGMRADGTLLDSGDLSVVTAGAAQAHGQNLAGGELSFSGSALDLSGSETGGANISIAATGGNVDTSGALLSTAGTLELAAAGTLVNAKGTLSAGQLEIAAGGVDNTGGAILQSGSGDTVLAAGTLTNIGGRIGVNSANLRIDAGALANAGGAIEHAGSGALTVRAATIDNTAGRIGSAAAADIAAATALRNDAGIIAGANDLRIAGGAIDNGGGLIQATTGILTLDAASLASAGGEVSAGGDLRLSLSGDLTNGGLVYAGGAQALDVDGVLHNGGAIAALGNLDVTAGSVDSDGLFGAGMRADGSLAGAGNLAITSAGSLRAAGDNLAAGAISLQGASVDLADSETGGASIAVQASAGAIDTSGAVLSTAGVLALSGDALVNRDGELGGAQVSLDVLTLDNADGVIVQNGAGDMTVAVTALDNTGGGIAAANGSLVLTASSVNNTRGELAAAGSLRIAGGADLVNEGGRIQGAAGDVSLQVRDLHNDGGSVFAGGSLATTARHVDNGGSLFAAGGQTLAASGAINNDGVIAAQCDTTVSAASLSGGADSLLGAGIRADGSLGASGKLAVTTTGALQARGQVLAGGNAELTGASVNLAGSQASAANLALTAKGGNVDTGAATVTTGTLALTANQDSAQSWNNTRGDLLATQLQVQVANLNNTSGIIIQTGAGDAVLSATGALDNTGGRIAANSSNLTLAANQLSNAGGSIEHAGTGALAIQAGRFDGHDGDITSNGHVAITAAEIDHRNADLMAQQVTIGAGTLDNSLDGEIIQRGTGQANITIANGLNNAGGRIGSNGSTTIVAGAFDNTGGDLQAGGTANLSLSVSGLLANSSDGSIAAGGNAVISAGSLDNRYGTATAAGTMTLTSSGTLANAGGTLASEGDLAVSGAGLDNTSGQLASVQGKLTLDTAGAATNTGGRIQAAGTVGIASTGMVNGAGGIVSGRDVNIDTRGQGLDNALGTIAATQAARLQTGELNNSGGRIQSGTTLLVDTHGQALTNTNAAAYSARNPGYGGGITGGGATTLYTGNLDNSGGFLAGGGQLSGSTAYLTNTGGEIAGMAGISFNIGGLSNQDGRIQALGGLNLNAGAGAIVNYSGLLRSGQALTLSAASVDNRSTLGPNEGIEGQDLVVNAASVNNDGGALRANNNLSIGSAGAVQNNWGLMSAYNSLSIQDAGWSRGLAVYNTGGTLIGGQLTALRAASLAGAGRVLSQQDLSLDLAGGYALDAGSEIIGNRNVNFTLGGGLSNAGKLQAGGTLTLNAASLDNGASGDINAGATRINAGGWLTNRGIIDGIQTEINTGTLTNLGTGRIYGDRISIGAGNVVNDVEGGTAGTIAARGYMALGAANISNREHALIFSGGDMVIGGAVDGNRNAYGSASMLTNASARIEALGNLVINAGRVEVLNNHFSWTYGADSAPVTTVQYKVGDKTYASGSGVYTMESAGNTSLYTPDGLSYFTFEKHTVERTTSSTVVTSSDPGVIGAGNDVTINAASILNDNSQIVAGRSVWVPSEALENRSTTTQTIIRERGAIDYYSYRDEEAGYSHTGEYTYGPSASTEYTLPDVIVGGGGTTSFEWTRSTAPGAKAGVAVSGATSAAGAASVGQARQIDVNGPSDLAAVDAATGQSAAIVADGTTSNGTARLGTAGQTGPVGTAVRAVQDAVLAGTQNAGQTGSVGAVDLIDAAGPIVGTSAGDTIGSGTATQGEIELAARKLAGGVGTIDTVEGKRGTGAIAIGSGSDGNLLNGTIGKAVVAARKKADEAAAIEAVGRAPDVGTIAAPVTESNVSDGVATGPAATVVAGVNGAAPSAGAGPKPGTAKPNVRGIAQVPLANPTGSAEVVRTSTLPPAVPNASLYQITPAPEARYLVETDPRFANYREWTSADYLTAKVPTDPSVTQKRLGDGFYEQQLVREQMTALTGYRYSGDYTSDEEQYRGLMDAAASFANTWNLRPGVALTPAQMASLTSDIVWLVEQDVTLADGSSQKVLVPQVYVRLREGDLDGSGALLSGKEVNIALGGDLTNSGTIAGREVVRISAENVENLSGRIHGDNVAVDARNDLNNISGTISANNALVATAGRDLNIATGVANIDRGAGGTASALGRVAGLYVTGGEGTLLASAGRDMTIAGGIVNNTAAAGTTNLLAAGNLNVHQAVATTTSTAYGAMPVSAVRNSELSAAGSMALKAGTDLNVVGSSVSANQTLIASAGRDINLRTTTSSTSANHGRVSTASTDIDALAGLYVNGTGADSKLIVSAGRDINLAAGVITNAGEGGNTVISALRDLNLGTVGIAARKDDVKNANNYRKESTTEEVGSLISGAGSVLLSAGNDLNVRAGEVDAATSLNLSAGNDIDITTGTATYSLDQSSQTVKKKTFSKKVTTKRDTVDTATSIASALTGGTVSMSAGNDLNIAGSAVVGDDAVLLAAKNDINIQAGIDTNREWNHVEEKKSGFLGGGFGISYGTRTTTTDQNRDAVTQSGQARSMVGSIGGNLTLDAGNAIKVGGTDMSAGQDMSLTAKNVTIDPGKDQIDGKLETRVVQDAISLKVGGSVVNAIQAVQSVQQTAKATDNKRVQAMAAATAAMAAKNAAADIQQNGFSISLSLTAGHSESVQTTTTSETLHTGSVLTAGRDVSIVAKGDGANSDINIVGSEINAGRNVALAADDQVNLVAAQDLESQHSESKSISAEAGVAASYSSNGGAAIGFTATVSASKGHEDGQGTTQVNSYVNAGQRLTIASGGDTNIKGAVASANQVVADVGGDLNLESLQDTAKFDSKTQSASVSGTVGFGASVSGSFNQSKITSDYASVQEQSGIKAGDGGFQIKVGGNTDLKGAVISSTEEGIAANSLVTRTLTQSDIENYATMEASSVGLSGSTTTKGTGDKPTTGKGTVGLKDMGESGSTAGISGIASTSSSDSSITKSGISAGTVVVTDDAAQRALVGQGATETIAAIDRDVATGVDTSGSLANNFDLAEVQTTLDVTASFSTAATWEVGVYADKQLREADELESKAVTLPDGPERAEMQLRAAEMRESWKEGGTARVALHATVGGVAGGSGGAVGAAASALATPLLHQEIRKLGIPSGLESALLLAAGATVGAAAGGEAGALAATNEVQNNYLKHKELTALRDELANCDQRKCSPGEREKIVNYYAELSAKNDKDLAACVTKECVEGHAKEIQSASKIQHAILSEIDGRSGNELRGRQEKSEAVSYQYKKVETLKKDAEELQRWAINNCEGISLQDCSRKLSESKQQIGKAILDFIPVIGDVKGFVEAETKADYALAVVGMVGGPLGDAFKAAVKGGKAADALEDVVAVDKAVEAEKEALQRISKNANGPNLNGKVENTVLNKQMILNMENGKLPGTPIGEPWTPRSMPAVENPSATAENFAKQLIGNVKPEEFRAMPGCDGCWYVKTPDGAVTYRPAGEASKRTLSTTATLEITLRKFTQHNLDKQGEPNAIKLKFPKKG